MGMFDLDSSLLDEKKKGNYEEELKKARALCIRGQYEKSLAIYNAILDEDYENEDALIGLLRVHSKDFREYVSQEIEDDIHAIEGMCPDTVNEEYLSYMKARQDYLAAHKKETPKADKVEAKEAKEKEPKAKKAEVKQEKPLYKGYEKNYEAGKKAFKDKDYEYALLLYEEAVKNVGKDLGDLYCSGCGVANCYTALEQYDEAVEYLIDLADKLKSNDYFYALVTKKIAYNARKNGDYHLAISNYDFAFDFFKKDKWERCNAIDSAYFEGYCYEQLGDYDKALKCYIKASGITHDGTGGSLGPNYVKACFQGGELCRTGKAGRVDISKARELYQKGANLKDPDCLEALKKL